VKVHHWTKTQAFFALMGGFGDKAGAAGQIYSPSGVDFYNIDMPTDDEILDKSKQDILVKVFALLQTIWFIAVTLFRFQSDFLFATEIEVVTFTFASVSFFTNLIWWSKPKDVDIPFLSDPKPPAVSPKKDTLSPNFFKLATAILRSDGDNTALLIDKSDIHAYHGQSPSDNMTIPVLIASLAGTLYGICHVVVSLHGGLTSAHSRIWFVLALVGSTLPFYLLLLAVISSLIRICIGEAEAERFLRGMLKYTAQIALILSGIGRIGLIAALAYFMVTPYDEGAYLTPSWSQYIIHPF